MRYINLTPHPVNFLPASGEGPIVTLPVHGPSVRIQVQQELVGTVEVPWVQEVTVGYIQDAEPGFSSYEQKMVENEDGEKVPSGFIVRYDRITEVNQYRTEFGEEITNFPEEDYEDAENVFIVPTLSKTHPRLKDDVRFVTPGRLVRDENGVILYADGISI